MGLASLRHGGIGLMPMRNQPHDVQGLWVYFGSTRWAAITAGCPTDSRVKSVVRSRRAALGTVKKTWCPTGMFHRQQQESIEHQHGALRILRSEEHTSELQSRG